MKKVMFFGLMVMVSVMVFGTSIAEERVKGDNMIASVPQEGQSTVQTSKETEGILVADVDCEGGAYDYETCMMIKDLCTIGSPINPGDLYCNKNWNEGMCGDCYP